MYTVATTVAVHSKGEVEARLQRVASYCSHTALVSYKVVTLDSAQCTVHSAHCTLGSAHCKLKSANCTLDSEHCTLNSEHCTLHSKH